MINSVLAVIAGFFVMAVVVMLSTPLLMKIFMPWQKLSMEHPPASVPKAYLIANLSAGAIAAFVGGYVTGTIANTHVLRHGGALAVLMVLMSVASMRRYRGKQPQWYTLTLATVMPLIAVLGAWVCAQRMG